MKQFLFLAACALIMLTGCENVSRPNQKRVILNHDGTGVMSNIWFGYRPLTKSDLEAYVDAAAENTQLTTFMMCSGSDYTFYRSKYARVYGDDRDGTLGCDDPQILADARLYYRNFLNLEAEGVDMIGATLLRAQENGLEAFITYRMNDLHFNDTTDQCSIHIPDFWRAHPQYWLGDTTQGWHSAGAFDFSFPEVRERKLAMITEQLERYEMLDGIELDFMRFPVYFKADEGPQNAHLITALVRQVRGRVDSLSEVRGKKILLAVRVPLSIEGCRSKGLDVQEWARQELVDFVSIGIHWRGEPSLPIAKFRREFGYDDIPVYGTVDAYGYFQIELWSHGMFRGMATRMLNEGDGVYLFNYYPYPDYLAEEWSDLQTDRVSRLMNKELLRELGSLETLRGRNKIYCESDGVSDNYLLLQESTLPLAVSDNSLASANLYIGDDVQQTVPLETALFVRTDRPADFRVWVNGVEATEQRPDYPKSYLRDSGMEENDRVYAFIVPREALQKGDNTITFRGIGSYRAKSPMVFIVRRLEALLNYGPVETHGYF